MSPEPANRPTSEIIDPEKIETQLLPESFLAGWKNKLSEFRDRFADEFERKVALGNLQRFVFDSSIVALVIGAGAAGFVYLVTTDFNPNPSEVESQIEVVDPETR
jgi:hypothetical protein